ncbi:metacaspase [Rhizoclosmatium globosum]|uniref:Metacaspase n=1 Tax=Rhizoclosmatium globosum TaxID=329046 RepID=A0A1Y2CE15_9FUNG|nr:metacaspase [Rhizoclosmatium globosum]|eukprot:ORY45301.1 metacaspase [Rhizoclosmatium globosum]
MAGANFTSSGRKKALLVGINYIGSKHALAGCINDAHNLQNFLVQQYGYKTDQRSMLVMTDDNKDPRYVPTTKNLLGAFHWLVYDARPGDHLFFSYSGHGGQVPDTNDNDRASGMDDTICPVDFEQSGQIDSDLLHKALVTALPDGVKLVVVMDCCHSGTMLELPYTYAPDENGQMNPKEAIQVGIKVFTGVTHLLQGGFSASKIQEAKGLLADVKGLAHMFSGSPATTDNNGYKREEFSEAKTETPKEAYLIAGCLDAQTSADTSFNGQASGALTYALLNVLRENKQLSYEQLLAQLRGFMQGKFSQVPQLSCGKPVDPQSTFTL